MIHFRSLSLAGITTLALAAALMLGTDLSVPQQWHLILQRTAPESFADYSYFYGHLPRLIMAIIVGGTLGFVGSLMQQLTQNPLTSPLTLGTSSGAWLALIIMNVWFTQWVAQYSAIAAMAGALSAFMLIVAIVGLKNLSGLPIVVAGMVVNILLGAIATGIILLNEQYAQNIFMWGAGDLAQNGWDQITWLLPKLVLFIPLMLFAPRALALLKLGKDGASSRGLAVIPVFFILMISGIWLASAAITSVGVIGFIGLISPNIARAWEARTPRQELTFSVAIGAILLLLTDRLAFFATQWSDQLIPSGITAALIGAPALIWFSRRQLKAQDSLALILPSGRRHLSPLSLGAISSMLLIAIMAYGFIDLSQGNWQWHWPSAYQWQIRWPRLLTAAATGLGLAVAGVILQRLIYNPLASPDILGVSAGATLAMVASAVWLGQTSLTYNWLAAIAGSLVVLVCLLLLARKHQYTPSSLILTGIAITALIDAVIQFCLAQGTSDSYRILLWLSGSTYRTSAEQSVTLTTGVLLLLGVALICSRWLNVISIGRAFALARGINVSGVSLVLLLIVALMCAMATATMGPVAFVGLIAPHLAIMLGATSGRAQLCIAALIGTTLMLWADWLGQTILYPDQVAAGTLVSIIGGGYFIALLLISRLKRS
ncbi:Fe(3+)-hydroxamate ABC transporter permease FhuB [Marinomonas ostreistagni]|uniref:Fe(3+)-hydroxamate ABC transporter permease FhuB n=1 Tax=Marinomonas ostreistagni TaxID=359209 RepID=UPI0019511945|nr:Fe(3+)-hydroxamate ABC transporter permease FhuB [Marinomonas ostreistagni]MBM6550511.1 Fe(3+)-hydroxamate ABC transporter permease FhuB [Marinomonas ostreistagni]